MIMKQRYAQGPKEVAALNTAELRDNFLIEDLMQPDQFNFTYSHYDRAIIGSVSPVNETLELPNYENLRSDYFLERREIGMINVGGDAEVTVDGTTFAVSKLDAVYAGKGVKSLTFKSLSADNPAKFFLYSVPAHQAYPTRLMKKEE
ncbi:MAG: 5-dehydro-4-deoxy-D-glucuronate isomerase, partial [Sphingobacteriales bacterium]